MILSGQLTYIVLDTPHILESYRHAKEISFDHFIKLLMIFAGVSKPTRDHLCSTGDGPQNGAAMFRKVINTALFHGQGDNNVSLRYRTLLQDALQPRALLYRRPAITIPGRLSVSNWTMDLMTSMAFNSHLGKTFLDMHPECLDSFRIVAHDAWVLGFDWPINLVSKPHFHRDKIVHALSQYYELPQTQRADQIPFLGEIEGSLRSQGIQTPDIAALTFQMLLAIGGNPPRAAFWLLSHILYDKTLLDQLRAECATAFDKGANEQPDISVLLDQCPKLNAAFQETLRLYTGIISMKRLVNDTTIGGYHLQRGADVLIPYRFVHLNPELWGTDCKTFNCQRFLHNPSFATANFYRPFGGGSSYCSGRNIARQIVLSFVATVITRYNVEVVNGIESQPFPKSDEEAFTFGLLPPAVGQDIEIMVSRRE
ncbi:hypothetical protein FE257_004979 [Aspergillus nanangensis]|uniref:Cytochrome P450 n=1 Tax=Aspergillus nanangensis TaxID=2582783 RepID=A0AAD4GUV5_ASPNN|nr:hypothetical protein FE257_004979 [Aspergillus nanangensis]